eukprot:scaffold2998_cov67-Phaeocystis_antarctica.AAC.2
MSWLFHNLNNFNADVSSWDTSSVTRVDHMFYGASVFNQPLTFDTSKVTAVNSMFRGASAFNQPLSLDTSSVTDTTHMFEGASAFNQPLSFDTSSVTDMRHMFSGAPLSDANKLLIRCAWAGTSAFASSGYGSSWGPGSCPPPPSPSLPPAPPSPPLIACTTRNTFTIKASLRTAVEAFNADPAAATVTYGPIADWCVSAITDMSWLFHNMNNSNADVSSWDTSSVTRVDHMFYGASAFNQPLTFDTSKVTAVNSMFRGASAFNQPLSLDTSSVTDTTYMFEGASAFNQPLSFDTSSVTDMRHMFSGAPLSAANKLLIRCAWAGTSAFASSGYGSSWGPGTCPGTFTSAASLKTAVQAYNADPAAAIATYGTLYGLIADWDVSAVTDMSYLFKDLKNFNTDVSSWDTSSVTRMDHMFYGASVFNQPLSFNTSSVMNMGSMFRGASAFNQPLSFDTSSVTDMDYMFLSAGAFNQPLSLDTSSVTSMGYVFYFANSLSAANKLLIRCAWAGTSAFASTGYGSSWGPGTCPATFTSTASLKTAVQAYNADPAAAIATYGLIADWDVSAVTDMSYLFKDLKNFNTDVSSWDTSSVTNMNQMFYGASAFNQPLTFDTSSVITMPYMFRVRSSPCPAPNLQSSPPLHAA